MTRGKVSGWWGVLAFGAVIVAWDVVAEATGRMETISTALHRFHDSGPTGEAIVSQACNILKVHLTL